jgi:hypothetical protein
MAVRVTKLGPGTITVGEVGSLVDFSCQLQNAQVEWDKDKDDDVTVLCGDVVPGSTDYSATITGTVFQDIDDVDGIVFYSWEHKGEAVPFEFVPSTPVGTSVTGTVILDPITVGADEPKANMQSDFTWDCVGAPTLTAATPLAATSTKSSTKSAA